MDLLLQCLESKIHSWPHSYELHLYTVSGFAILLPLEQYRVLHILGVDVTISPLFDFALIGM